MRRAFEGLVRLIWGRDLDPALRPVIGVAIGSSVAKATAFTFLGVWAIEQLDATQVELSFGFLGGAIAALAAGYAGGHLSDRVGRRAVLLTASARGRRSCRSASSSAATGSCRGSC